MVRRLKSALLFIGLAAISCGCATESSLKIASNPPQADVYIDSLGNQSPKLAGQTPLVLKSSQIREKFAGSGPVEISIQKSGFEPVKTIVTDMGAGDLNLNVELPPEMVLEEVNGLNDSIDLVFEGQRLARAGRYADALSTIHRVEMQFPQIAASYEIEGGIHFLKKDYNQALDAYRTAIRLNPRNPNAIRMRDILEQRAAQGPGSARVPAGGAN